MTASKIPGGSVLKVRGREVAGCDQRSPPKPEKRAYFLLHPRGTKHFVVCFLFVYAPAQGPFLFYFLIVFVFVLLVSVIIALLGPSPSLLVVTQIRVHKAGSSLPPPPLRAVRGFSREKRRPALSFLADSCRILHTYTHQRRFLLSIWFKIENQGSKP